MCTLAQFNRDFLLAVYNPVDVLEDVFSSLEQRDGMGIAALMDSSAIQVIGSHDATPLQLAEWCVERMNEAQWFTFHSRQATTAPRFRNDLVQPFISEDGSFVLCHVGTISNLDIWSIDGSPVSDGRMVFELASKYSADPLRDLFKASFIPCAGYLHGIPFHIGSLTQYTAHGSSGVLFTSSGIGGIAGCYRSRTQDSIWVDGTETMSFFHTYDKITHMPKDVYYDR